MLAGAWKGPASRVTEPRRDSGQTRSTPFMPDRLRPYSLCGVDRWSMRRAMSTALTPVSQLTDLDLPGRMSLGTRHHWAMADVAGGARLWRLALTLGWLDIRLRYRGSMLGPFWLTISTGVMVAALGFLYSKLFKLDLRDLSAVPGAVAGAVGLPSLAWCRRPAPPSPKAEGVIRSVRMPFSVFSHPHAVSQSDRAAAQRGRDRRGLRDLRACGQDWELLLAIPGLLLWVVDALALTLILGAFCARFRDIQPIVNSVMQIAFFMTPVIWKADQLGPKASLAVRSIRSTTCWRSCAGRYWNHRSPI